MTRLEQIARKHATAHAKQWLNDDRKPHPADTIAAALREWTEEFARATHDMWENGIPAQEFATRIRAMAEEQVDA